MYRLLQVLLCITALCMLVQAGTLFSVGHPAYLGEAPYYPTIAPFVTRGSMTGFTFENSSISVGEHSTFVTHSSGEHVHGVGWSQYGILGHATVNVRQTTSVPVKLKMDNVLKDKKILQIAAGSYYTIALANDGNLYSWGTGNLGNGISSSYEPTLVDMTKFQNKTIVKVVSGVSHVLVLTSDGSVYSWGDGVSGALGSGSVANRARPDLIYMQGALAGLYITDIAAGAYHSIAIANNSRAYAWGYNLSGQLGINSIIAVYAYAPALVSVSGILAEKNIAMIAAGGVHTVLLTEENELVTFGSNSNGQLGIAETSVAERRYPVFAKMTGALAGKTITKIVAGFCSTIVQTSDLELYSWGCNGKGQLGDSTTTDRYEAVRIPITVTQSLVLPDRYFEHMVFLADDVLYGFGSNYYAALNTVNSLAQYKPANPMQEQPLRSMETYTTHALITGRNSTIYAWGNNVKGQLGNGVRENMYITQYPRVTLIDNVLNGESIIATATGEEHSIALTDTGRIYGWGENRDGAIGDGTQTDSYVPTATNLTAFEGRRTIQVVAGNSYTLALTEDGRVFAWGAGANGQLGDGLTGGPRYFPVPTRMDGVLAGQKIVQITTRASGTLAVTSSGKVFGWGHNTSGRIGNGGKALVNNLPLATNMTGVLSGKFVVQVALGDAHAVALTSEGKVYTWGTNAYGSLGIGINSTVLYTNPVEVDSTGVMFNKTIIAIAAGEFHTVALSNENEVFAWGSNHYGQLGDGTNEDRFVPVAMDISAIGNQPIFQIRASEYNTYILAHPESCTGRYDRLEECVECEGNWDKSTDCTSCKGNWDISTLCTTCNAGWEVGADGECSKAICSQECSGGSSCTAPDTCTCNTNYNLDLSGNCTCINNYDIESNCTACLGNWDEADQCMSCKSGWVVGDDLECSEYYCNDCGQGGQCFGPNDCLCEENYEKDTNGACSICSGNFDIASNCTQCKTGYTGDDCDKPVCADGCGDNGYCSSPDQCTCNNNYATGSDGRCIICKSNYDLSSNCTQCTGNREVSTDCSTCKSGWKFGTDGECSTAVCSGGCSFGTCIRPGECSCNSNYATDTNGKCTICFGNYDIATSCTSCIGKWDLSSNCSICEYGWSSGEDNQCSQAECTTDCGIGGVCSEPEICTCIGNYIRNGSDTCSICKANFDISTACTKCITGYEGVDCMSQVPTFSSSLQLDQSGSGEVSAASALRYTVASVTTATLLLAFSFFL